MSQANVTVVGSNQILMLSNNKASTFIKRAEITSPDNVHRLDVTSKELAILKKLPTIPSGTWFEYQIEGNKYRRKIKLSWYNNITKKYIFVAHGGMQTVNMSARTLARDIHRGNAKIIGYTGSPYSNRILGLIYNKVRLATGVVYANKHAFISSILPHQQKS